MPPPPPAEDTIVVKGDYGWHPPSSPESTQSRSPKQPPLDLNLLAQSDTRKHESPEPLDENIPSIPNKTPQSQPSPTNRTPSSSRGPKKDITTMEERLYAMPEKRPLPWRPGVEPGAEIETGGDSRRKQIRFGCLLATRGDVAPVPCNSCANGRGKFNICVALEGYFKGACASCQLSGRPNRCSIKQSDEEVLQSPKVDVETPSKEEIPIKEPERPSSTTLQSSGPPPAKRKRPNPVSEWEKTRPQWDQELGGSHARQPMNEIIPVQRPWATVNAPGAAAAPLPPTQSLLPQASRNGIYDGYPRNSIGWAAVNQPTSRTPPQRLVTNKGVLEDSGHSARGKMQPEKREPLRNEDMAQKEESSVALIDQLPKNQQRKVYGLVSGLQGGIQQLQRELDLLKKALGIDEEY